MEKRTKTFCYSSRTRAEEGMKYPINRTNGEEDAGFGRNPCKSQASCSLQRAELITNMANPQEEAGAMPDVIPVTMLSGFLGAGTVDQLFKALNKSFALPPC